MTALVESPARGRVVERQRVPMRPNGRRRPGVRRAAAVGGPPRRPRAVTAPRLAPGPACGAAAAVPGWLTTLAIGAFVALFILGFGLISGMSGVGAPVPAVTKVVYVHPGDTVWSIARDAAPGSAPDAVVHRIQSLNGLGQAAVHPGEALRVPDAQPH